MKNPWGPRRQQIGIITELGITHDTLAIIKTNDQMISERETEIGVIPGMTTQTFEITTRSKTSEIPDKGIDPTTMNQDTGIPWLPLRRCTKKITSTVVEMITSTTNSAFSTKCA
jgi:hypothetical protein